MHALPGRNRDRQKTGRPCHYDVLGVKRGATEDEIRRAYKKLALFWHPDKNPDNEEEAAEIFQLVAEAYAVLSDPLQKRKYDREGHPQAKGKGSTRTSPAPSATPSRRNSTPAAAPASFPSPAPARAPSAPPRTMPSRASAPVPPGHSQQTSYAWKNGGGSWQNHGQGMHPAQGMHPGVYDPASGWQQSYPYQQATSFHQQPHFQQQPGVYPQQGAFQQQGAFPYTQPFSQQQTYQQPQPAFGAYYGGTYGGTPAPHAQPASAMTSTALSLERVGSPPQQRYDYFQAPFGFSGAFSQASTRAPVLRPPSPHGSPSSDSSSESEEESDGEVQVVPVATFKPALAPSPAVARRPQRSTSAPRLRPSLLRRRHAKPDYPTETRHVPQVSAQSNPGYPRETRSAANHQSEPRPATRRLSFSLGLSAKGNSSGSPPLSRSHSYSEGRSRDGGDQFPPGDIIFGKNNGLIRHMDRMFSSLFGGSFGAGIEFTAEEEVVPRSSSLRSSSMSRSASAFSERTIGGEGVVRSHSSSKSWGTGMGRLSSRSSKTTRVGLDGVPRTVFSRSERTVVNPDGSRNSKVEEFRDASGRRDHSA